MEFTLLWAAGLGMGAALLVARLESRAGLGPKGSIADLSLGSTVFGVFAGRIASMLLAGVNPLAHPADILVVRAGVDTGFAAAGALGFAMVASRRNLRPTLDALAPVALIGLSGWHAGCLFRAACLGTVSSLPWAVAQEGSEVTRHPVEVYAALLFLLGGIWLFRRLRRGAGPPGGAAAMGLALAALIRLATEPLRPSLGGGPVWWYAGGLALGLTAWVLLWFRHRTVRT